MPLSVRSFKTLAAGTSSFAHHRQLVRGKGRNVEVRQIVSFLLFSFVNAIGIGLMMFIVSFRLKILKWSGAVILLWLTSARTCLEASLLS